MKKLALSISIALSLAACGLNEPSKHISIQSSAVTINSGDIGLWGTSFTGAVVLNNISNGTITWSKLKVKLANGSSISGTPWGAAATVTPDANGYYTFTANSWGGNTIPAGSSVTINYNGIGTTSKLTECYLDNNPENLCSNSSTDTTAPNINLSSSGTVVNSAGNISFTATASDNIGVSKVEFYDGSSLLASQTTAPFTYTASYTANNNGLHSYSAKAYDAAGNVSTSGIIGVQVNIPTTTPAVTLAASSSTVTTASTLTLSATPSNVTPSKVEFYSGSTLIKTVSTAPYTYALALTSANNGNKTFSAKVYNSGSTTAVATSNVVNVVVNIPSSTTPAVTLAASSSTVTTAGTLTLSATPRNVTPSKVEFYSGSTLIKTVSTAPYTYALALTSTNNGAKTFSAKVYSSGSTTAVATSNVVNVVVNIPVTDSTKPSVQLASSSNTVTTAGTLTLTATATDNVGVSKVEFWDGTTLMHTDTTAPYNHVLNLTNANNGSKSYTAKAFDAAGNTTTSSPVSVVVNIAGLSQADVRVQGRAVLSTAGWQSTWPGVQWATSFTGTAIGVQFNDAQNYYQIELDGVISQVTPASGERTIWFENLSNSQHSIKVLRKNESAFSASGLFKGFVLKNSADRWLPASVNSKSIEFIGDSYTVALGNTSTSRTCTDAQISATTDASQGFAKLTAQALGADVQINAMSGMGIIRNWDGNGAPNNFRSYYPYTLQTDLSQSYNNPNWQPQVVVIGLGINDFSTEVHAGEAWTTESLASEYVSQYKNFLAGIKSKYNNPQIILTATYLWPNDRMRPLVQQVVNDEKAAGNNKISYMDLGTLELTGCQWHPSLNDHKNIKDKLLNLINTLNVW